VAGNEQLRLAAEREAYLLDQLGHPALPAVVDSFSTDAACHLVMSFIPGLVLAEQLTRRPTPFPTDTVLDWADQLLDLLGYLHSRQPRVIHRDIKPNNLKIGVDGPIVLLDFGLAKGLSDSPAANLAGYTVSYAPPEQLRGEGTEPRSDLYLLAATLYELLTRRWLPDALQRETAVIDGRGDPLAPDQTLNPAVPATVAAVSW
jgi:eukaryotic-like serine/threonine-protein kinase